MDRLNRTAGTISDRFFSCAQRERIEALSGFGRSFYRTAAHLIPTEPSGNMLELACGTASLTLAVAEKHQGNGRYHGVDVSARKLAFAARKARKARIFFDARHCSMEALPFQSAGMDAVVAGPSFHRTSPQLRRKILQETARVLKPKGVFALVDWSKPKFGLRAMVFYPFLAFNMSGDHWNNTYPELCHKENLLQITDTYINSMIRCQVFRKI